MQIKGFKILIIIIALVVMLGVLFSGQFLYQREYVDRPIAKLRNLDRGILNLQLERTASGATVRAKLAELPDFQKTYLNLEQAVQGVLGDETPVRFNIEDRRNALLEKALYQSQFVIYEAIENGHYTVMANDVAQIATRLGLDRNAVYIDADNIYLQLHQGRNYLYAIFPRDRLVNAARESVVKG